MVLLDYTKPSKKHAYGSVYMRKQHLSAPTQPKHNQISNDALEEAAAEKLIQSRKPMEGINLMENILKTKIATQATKRWSYAEHIVVTCNRLVCSALASGNVPRDSTTCRLLLAKAENIILNTEALSGFHPLRLSLLVSTFNNTASVMLSSTSLHSAKQILERALVLEPTSPLTLVNTSIVAALSGDLQSALSTAQHSLNCAHDIFTTQLPPSPIPSVTQAQQAFLSSYGVLFMSSVKLYSKLYCKLNGVKDQSFITDMATTVEEVLGVDHQLVSLSNSWIQKLESDDEAFFEIKEADLSLLRQSFPTQIYPSQLLPFKPTKSTDGNVPIGGVSNSPVKILSRPPGGFLPDISCNIQHTTASTDLPQYVPHHSPPRCQPPSSQKQRNFRAIQLEHKFATQQVPRAHSHIFQQEVESRTPRATKKRKDKPASRKKSHKPHPPNSSPKDRDRESTAAGYENSSSSLIGEEQNSNSKHSEISQRDWNRYQALKEHVQRLVTGGGVVPNTTPLAPSAPKIINTSSRSNHQIIEDISPAPPSEPATQVNLARMRITNFMKLQKAVSGYMFVNQLASKWLQATRDSREAKRIVQLSAALAIQKNWKISQKRQQDLITLRTRRSLIRQQKQVAFFLLVRVMKGMKARRSVFGVWHRRNTFYNSAVRIQSYWRGCTALRRYKVIRKSTRIIQRVVRLLRAHKLLCVLVERRRDDLSFMSSVVKATLQIQHFWRMHNIRQSAVALLSAKKQRILLYNTSRIEQEELQQVESIRMERQRNAFVIIHFAEKKLSVEYVEKRRGEIVCAAVLVLQRTVRKFLSRKTYYQKRSTRLREQSEQNLYESAFETLLGIQRLGRGMLIRSRVASRFVIFSKMRIAAIRIQSQWRRFATRNMFLRLKYAWQEQRYLYLQESLRHYSAEVIQKQIRIHQDIEHQKTSKLINQHAIVIQCCFRKSKARNRTERLRKIRCEERGNYVKQVTDDWGALTIQLAYRRYVAMKLRRNLITARKINDSREVLSDVINYSAIKIQSNFRRHVSQQKYTSRVSRGATRSEESLLLYTILLSKLYPEISIIPDQEKEHYRHTPSPRNRTALGALIQLQKSPTSDVPDLETVVQCNAASVIANWWNLVSDLRYQNTLREILDAIERKTLFGQAIRRAIERENAAALIIQKQWKCYLAKEEVCRRRMRLRREVVLSYVLPQLLMGNLLALPLKSTQLTLQDEAIIYTHWSVLSIQTWWRSVIGRRAMSQYRRDAELTFIEFTRDEEYNWCATLIKKVYKGYSTRNDIKLKHEAAKTIQSVRLIMNAKEQVRNLRNNRQQLIENINKSERSVSAIVIQKAWRRRTISQPVAGVN